MKRFKILLLLALSLIVFSGCTKSIDNSPEGKAKECVNNLFKSIKEFDLKSIYTYFNETDEALFDDEFTKGEAIFNYFKKTNKKLKYSIDEVTVDGDNATVRVHCKYVDNSLFAKNFMGRLLSLAFDGEIKDDMSDKELEKLYDEVVEYASEDITEEIKEADVTLELIKQEDDSWKVEKLDKKLGSIILGNFDSALENWMDDDSDEADDGNLTDDNGDSEE